MRHAKNKKGKDRVPATIFLCFCLIVLTSIFTIQSSIDKVNERAKHLPVSQKTATNQESKTQTGTENESDSSETEATKESADLPVSSNIPTVDSAKDSPKETAQTSSYLPPLSLSTASVLKDYSMDMVIYNKTLDQYMTHPGIDLEAPSGSGINAIANGTVTAVYEDDAYGTTIEITHDHNVRSKYASLESSSLVETGDTVHQGQQIGTVGKTAPYETMEPVHLHFEIYKDDKLCNPADYITFE